PSESRHTCHSHRSAAGPSSLSRPPDSVLSRTGRTTKPTRRTEITTMEGHMTGTREEWRAARLKLLDVEKEHTRRGDELARQRQELPWVRIDKTYKFDTDE